MRASVKSGLTLTFPAVPSPPQRSVRDGWPLPHAHNTHCSHCSYPLRAYPYKRIRRPVMETQRTWSHNLLLDTFCSDQSLFGCLGGSWEMSFAGVWEVRCVWFGVFNVRCQINLSNLLVADSYCTLSWGVERSHYLLSVKGVASMIYSVLQQRLRWCITPSLWLQAWPKFPLPLLTCPPLLLLVILLPLWRLNLDGEQTYGVTTTYYQPQRRCVTRPEKRWGEG